MDYNDRLRRNRPNGFSDDEIISWSERQAAQGCPMAAPAPGLDPMAILSAVFGTRWRLANRMADIESARREFTPEQRDVFMHAVLEAPAHINNGNGTMSPVDIVRIGLVAVGVE